jgi:hypothetical protein
MDAVAADGDYRNGTTTRALRFVSILKSHHSSNRSHQGDGKRRKASGRSCLSAFATACTTAGRTSAGICATAASSRYTEASTRCLSARSRRSRVRRKTLNESLMARQTVRCGLRTLPSCAPVASFFSTTPSIAVFWTKRCPYRLFVLEVE